MLFGWGFHQKWERSARGLDQAIQGKLVEWENRTRPLRKLSIPGWRMVQEEARIALISLMAVAEKIGLAVMLRWLMVLCFFFGLPALWAQTSTRLLMKQESAAIQGQPRSIDLDRPVS